MPVSDANLILRSGTAVLTADSILAVKDIKMTPIKGDALFLIVPKAAGTSPRLAVYVRASSSSNPDSTETVTMRNDITAAGEYIVPFVTNKRYIEVFLDVSGTSPNFSKVKVYLTLNVGREWKRTENFL